MSQDHETKTCKMCAMGIPAAAKKCPYCLHWQRWWTLQHPLFGTLVVMVFVAAVVSVPTVLLQRVTCEWEPFAKHADQIKIVEEKMEFGEDQSGPAVVVVGRVKNLSQVDWKDVRFQVAFLNAKGQLFDAGQQECYTYRLPAGKETPFKVSFRRQFPEKEYTSHKVDIITAVDARKWP